MEKQKFPVYEPPPTAAKRGKLGQFCPPEHRGVIIEMFRRHWHHHSTIPTATGQLLSPAHIYRNSVLEMYNYCRKHELQQPWAYLWNCWYQRQQYVLWARSAHDAIPRLKTTMIAEGTFKQLKHIDLAYHNRPRLDHVVYIILHSFLPRLLDKLGLLLEKKRVGRPKGLAGWQKDLRRDWIFMSKSDAEQKVRRELAVRKSGLKGKARQDRLAQITADLTREAGTYFTSLEAWTCSCGAYLLSRFLTCKHLVRAAEVKIGSQTNNLTFFRQLRREHRVPYYRIDGIHAPIAPTPHLAIGPPPPAPLVPRLAIEAAPENVKDVREASDTDTVGLRLRFCKGVYSPPSTIRYIHSAQT